MLFRDTACSHGLGVVLEQEQWDSKLHPVAYANRNLRKGEMTYVVTELQALALCFSPYLLLGFH